MKPAKLLDNDDIYIHKSFLPSLSPVPRLGTQSSSGSRFRFGGIQTCLLLNSLNTFKHGSVLLYNNTVKGQHTYCTLRCGRGSTHHIAVERFRILTFAILCLVHQLLSSRGLSEPNRSSYERRIRREFLEVLESTRDPRPIDPSHSLLP